jgi:hypothetical protein
MSNAGSKRFSPREPIFFDGIEDLEDENIGKGHRLCTGTGPSPASLLLVCLPSAERRADRGVRLTEAFGIAGQGRSG